MTVTIFDVAKHAGVSIGTVSRVLNNKDRVSPATRERVLKAVQELDYHANAFARGLASQESNTLGLVIPQVNDPFFFQIVRGIEDAATDEGYSLLIASQPRPAHEHRYLDLFRRGNVDAMVLVAIDVYIHEIQQIAARGVPIVLAQQDVGKNIPAFLSDNYGGSRAMTEHLLGHGYRRLAYIAGTNYTPDSRERLRAMQDVLAEHGLNVGSEYIMPGDYLQDSGYRAMMELLNRPVLPEAVFAANDQMAIDAIRAIQESGLRVPDDIAVVGFDDIPMSSYVSPTLTTIQQPVYEIGWHAAKRAIAMIGPEVNVEERSLASPRVMLLPASLVVRRSCGC